MKSRFWMAPALALMAVLTTGQLCFIAPSAPQDDGMTDNDDQGGNDTDGDGDTTGDADGCPDDPDKIAPGVCGCGVADTDTDGDGTPDCNDACPEDPDKLQPGTCGCGVAETDTDGDGTPDCNDGCPDDAGKLEPGTCGCGIAETDTDGDGTPDCNDECPEDPDKTSPGLAGCGQPEPGGGGGGGTDDGATLSLDLGGGVSLVLVRIEAGTFSMGTANTDYTLLEHSRPVHAVTLGQSFYMGKYPVTQAQWEAVMGTTPWTGGTYVLEQSDAPATSVSWNNGQSFCQAVEAQTGYAVRLPTEAEWEYACRAGTTTEYSFGDDAALDLDAHAWYEENTWDEGEAYAHPVGQKLPNDFGLYDMHGNIYEWCEDEWHENYTGAPTDGSAWIDGSFPTRIIRGGSWDDMGELCRSATRYGSPPGTQADTIGFRLVLDAD